MPRHSSFLPTLQTRGKRLAYGTDSESKLGLNLRVQHVEGLRDLYTCIFSSCVFCCFSLSLSFCVCVCVCVCEKRDLMLALLVDAC